MEQKHFEVKSMHLSSAAINEDLTDVFRLINIQVRMNYFQQRDLLTTDYPTHAETADELGNAVRDEFNKLGVRWHLPEETTTKVKICDPNGFTEEASEKEFGWYKI